MGLGEQFEAETWTFRRKRRIWFIGPGIENREMILELLSVAKG